MLSRIRIVLVETTHPGNIGAAARAMKTMGLGDLWLVKPRAFPSAEATARASGADDLLAEARVVDRVSEAVADCRFVLGTSNRKRRLGRPVLAPREVVAHLREHPALFPAAILFGSEHSGLSNAQLDLCHMQVTIPTVAEFPALNIAAAVQVIAYEMRLGLGEAGGITPLAGDDDPPSVTVAEMERFYRHLEEVLVAIDFLDPARPRQLMRRLRRFFNRARPDANEMNILRGILTAMQHKAAMASQDDAGTPGSRV